MNTSLLRGQLQTVKNNFALAQFGIALMAAPDALERFEDALAKLGPHGELRHFDYIGYVFKTDRLLKHATQQFRSAVLRNCLKEAFELVKAHAAETGTEGRLKSQEWFPFLRIIRNCISHDMRLRFTPRDLAHLPVSWAGLTIDATFQGKEIPSTGFLTRAKSLELLDAVVAYAEHAG